MYVVSNIIILSHVSNSFFLTPLVKDVVTNMRELKELYCSEHNKLINC